MSKHRTIIIVTSLVLLTITLFFLPSLSTVFHSSSAHISLVESPFSVAKASDAVKADSNTLSLSQNTQENTLKEQPKTQNQTVQSSTYASEGIPPTQQLSSSSIVQGPSVDVVWSAPITERAVFITIDDGWFPSQSLLQMMQQDHFPVTAFLIQQAAQEHPDYWRAFVAAGGDIENHTLSHPDLTKIAPADLTNQLSTPMNYLGQFAAPPTLFRPPYGAFNSLVQQEVYQAGMKHLVMWNAVMSKGVLQTYNGKPIQPGSIILLHWEPGLSTQIKDLMGILQQEHLGIASLPVALAHPEKFPITWLTPEKNTQPVNSAPQQQPSSTQADPAIPSDQGNGA
ncbi:MAG: polysaccharide deacetylase family protein [Desulfosporosinus sp.]|nr:polysaccharide deacetylase family protein [Desulfosporosinus sp.]